MLFDAVNGLAGRNAALDAVMLFAAGPLIYILGAVAGLVALLDMRHRDRTGNIWLVGQAMVALGLAFGVNRILRALAIHERPFQTREVHELVQHEPGVSFPSNHATAALTIAFVVGFLISKLWGRLLGVLAALVAISRVFVGVHWPSDVIVGGIVGLAATVLVTVVGRRLRDRFATEPSAPLVEPGSDETKVLPRLGHDSETVVIRRVNR
ncbi:MAG: phosphatase PAP2 family protein [Kibdelosporangium sp.]